MDSVKERFKINYSFGVILQHIETKELRYFHPRYNTLILDVAQLISWKDLIKFLNSIAEEEFLEKVKRPDASWKVVLISNLTFYVNKLKNAPFSHI